MQPALEKNSKRSNSFYHENKLYQMSVNIDQLLFDIKDYESGESVRRFSVLKKDTITFKNSPLLMQINDKRPRELKNTSKFLQELVATDIGVSVFKNKQNLFLTVGGNGVDSKVVSLNDFNMMDDFYADFPSLGFYNSETNYSVFFESIWTKKLEPTTQNHEPLAADKIYNYITNHKEISLPNILKLSDYSILGYYDLNSKEYVLRKFIDGFN